MAFKLGEMIVFVVEENQDILAKLTDPADGSCLRVSGLEKAAALAMAFKADLLVVPTKSLSLYAVLSRLTDAVLTSRILIINPELPYFLLAEKENGSSFHARIPDTTDMENHERRSA